MLSRRSVLRLAGAATGAAFAARSYGIDEVAAATAAVENRSPEEVAADETLLARHPVRLHARPLDDQPQQRQLVSQPHRRPRGVQALPGLLQPGAGLSPRADRAEHRDRPPPARPRSSAPIPKRSPSRATRASRCRSRRTAST